MRLFLVTLTVAYWPFGERPANSNSIESVIPKPAPNINVINEGLRSDDPNFDNTPKFNELLDKIGAVRTLYFPSGAYYFNSRPKLITKNLVIIGDGINATSLIRNYNASDYNDVLIYTQRTITIERVGIIAASGTSRGGAIRIEGEFANSSVLRDLYITGQTGGTFDIPLTLWNNDNKGIRGCSIENVKLFAATIHLAWFVNVRGLSVKNLGAYPAGGIKDHVTIQGYDSKLRSDNVQLDTHHLVKLYLYWSDNINITGPVPYVIPDKEKPSTHIMKNGEIIIR
jgi:hypothetical protein